MRHRRPSAGLGLLVAAAAMLGAGAMPASRPTLPDVPRTPDPEPTPDAVKLPRREQGRQADERADAYNEAVAERRMVRAEQKRQRRAIKRAKGRPTPTPGGPDGRE